MFGFSPFAIVVIIAIVFLIFGAGKLPEIGSGFGKALKNFKNSVSGKDEIDVTPEETKEEVAPKRKQISATPKKRTVAGSAKTKKTAVKSRTIKKA